MTTSGGTLDSARLERRALLVGGAALAVCLAGAAISRDQFFHAYLTAYVFYANLALGCLGLLMLHHLVGGRWGFVVQRILEAGARTLPLLALLFLPLLLGLRELYVWARPELVAADHLLHHKAVYLNVPFFLARTAGYFAVWFGLTAALTGWSAAQDATGEPRLTRRLQVLSGPGLVVFGGTVTFAAIDWVMSIEAHWFSSIYGVVFLAGQALAALAFAVVVLVLLVRRPDLAGVVGTRDFHDLGKLLLAFVMFWAYIAFSQFLIIWSGNLPEEITWYVHRMAGGWFWLAMGLIAFHFGVPFLLLLSRETKRRPPVLLGVAAGILAMRLVDVFWLVSPAFHPAEWGLNWMDLVAPLGLGGLWLTAFLRNLKRQPLLPQGDPRFALEPPPTGGH